MTKYRLIDVPASHPLATMASRNRSGNLVKLGEHRIVLYEKIGPGTHPCHWCKRPVRWAPGEGPGGDRLSCDHLNSDRKDNRPENLVPSCHGCNALRGHPHPPVRDNEPHIERNGKRIRTIPRTCEECAATFYVVPTEVRRGGGRFCGKSCASRNVRRHKTWSTRRKH